MFCKLWFEVEGKEIILNYLILYNKWLIYSMYFDLLLMLMLFRGGLIVWMNKEDVVEVGVVDNDWIECFNCNGVVVVCVVVMYCILRGMVFMYYV